MGNTLHTMNKTPKTLIVLNVLFALVLIVLSYQAFFAPKQSATFGDSGFPLLFSTATNSSSTCSGATSSILASRSGVRSFFGTVNDSATTTYLCLSGSCSTSTGIRLNANGGSFLMDQGVIYTGDISCIGASGSTTSLTYTVKQ